MNPWIVGVGSIILAAIIRYVVPLEKLSNAIEKLFSVSRNCILGFLNYELKVCWILAGIIALLFILCLITYFSKKQSIPKAEFLNYKSDTILNYKWKWTWKKTPNGYYLDNLHPICSICNTTLTTRMGMYGFKHYFCLRCDKEFQQPIPDLSEVAILIEDNIKRMLEEKKQDISGI